MFGKTVGNKEEHFVRKQIPSSSVNPSSILMYFHVTFNFHSKLPSMTWHVLMHRWSIFNIFSWEFFDVWWSNVFHLNITKCFSFNLKKNYDIKKWHSFQDVTIIQHTASEQLPLACSNNYSGELKVCVTSEQRPPVIRMGIHCTQVWP